ncbi:MAG: hypothetical protein A2087_14230 [Spirochaetes bacterium GWD1_61_31]|nr:MAG: hypothetical protein A2Y37_04120 [Spirochaetes bacterium GWB1_60_80]OHD30567.1 MAG: hypothetical protein A2004_05505 [Spirochaetes bacterium GWC1_61_12]OHD34835.1 MAG: hypothetical protein A2087_14230 [Spirochaetes bacterium GWD1_61_31]OHD46681.1 MAG: hypothetical protein A2Y35_11055 [Spirochaetes bacterium GWE1_60_18]OHD60310.1 MAG: hypothetical protein A2Y32_14620 [Spirochaetes bacterium GWF1_60_12]HAP44207.1 sulfonate ABC transporter substrate-binding protein [Spirochaetaceae bacter
MKRCFVILACLALGTSALTAFGDKAPSQTLLPETEASLPRRQIQVGALKGPTGLGMIYLFEEQPLLAANTSAVYQAVAAADIMTAKLLSGELDVAVLPVNLAAKLYNSGLDYQAVAVVGNGMVQVLTLDPAIGSLADLAGKTVYVAGQSATPDFLMRSLIRHYALEGINLSYQLPIPEIAASLVAGRIEHAVLPEPFVTMALNGNPSLRVAFDLGRLWTEFSGMADYPMSVLVIRRSLLTERPAAMQALVAAYRRSIERARANPAEAGALVQKHELGLTAAVASAAIPRSQLVFIDAQAARPQIESLLRLFLEAAPASIGGALPNDGFYAPPATP